MSGILCGIARTNGQPEDDDQTDECGGEHDELEPRGEVSEIQTAGNSDDHECNGPPAHGGCNRAMFVPVLQVRSEQSRLEESGMQAG